MAVKRKLNESDIPTPVTPDGQGGEEAENEEQDVQWEEEEVEKIEEAPGAGVKEPTTAAVKRTPTKSTFESFGLDGRLLQAIASEGFSAPTNVQSRAIPLALQGRDILARAKTGSGKTAAYVLPILQSLLKAKAVQSDRKAKKISALILVPTKELSSQVSKVVSAFAAYCAKDVRVLNLAQNTPDTVQRSLLAEYPDVVVATPARVKANLDTSAMTLDGLTHLVIDEADLVLSYGYEEDLQHVARAVPKGVQTFLMSATLSTEVDTLKGLFCRDPAVLELDEAPEERNKVTQYVVKCGEDEKFLLLYVIVKLKLIKGNMIIFVADIDRCYRVKLYLEQFGVKSCVLNSELPVNSRIHVVEEFNKNVYNIIIASDEHEVVGSEFLRKPQSLREIEAAKESKTDADGDARMVTNGGDDDEAKSSEEESMPSKKASRKSKPEKKKRRRPDREYGISRGIDFKNVACVLNFDLPPSATSYTHRIGRTARANKPGTALSFVVPSTLYRKHKAISTPACENDEAVLAEINKAFQKQTKKSSSSSKDTTNPGPSGLQAYAFDMTQIDPFRYRTSDALRAVTRAAIREARTSELRAEILKSERLKRHFEENPDDLRHLRHDGELRAARVQPHLKHVPDYLKPKTKTNDHGTGAGEGGGGEGEIFVGLGLGRSTENRIRKNRALNRAKGRGRIAKAKKAGVKAGGGVRGRDPLKTFNARGRGKK